MSYKLLIACINFNSYNELGAYLQSIDKAATLSSNSLEVDVAVADNTVERHQIINTNYSNINIQSFPFRENLGYIGGATKMFELLGEEVVKSYDFVIISNVDLTLDNTFFVELLKVNTEGVGFIAPRITTGKTGEEENPFLVSRMSALKIRLLILMYRFPLLFLLNKFRVSAKSKMRMVATKKNSTQEIYAGHGSIMIFSKSIVAHYFPIVYQSFMYGEEVYFAELTRAIKLKTIYAPNIKVNNIGNVSTQLLGNQRKCEMSSESFRYLYNIFWK